MTQEEIVQKIALRLSKANRVLFITGAGISAESGLPTYRGTGGLYTGGMTEDGVEIEDAISGRMLKKNPALVWKYIKQIEQSCTGAKPNDAHRFIAEIEALKPETWVLTQNIDGFHHQAGSKNVIEIHGNLRTVRCTTCDVDWTYKSERIGWELGQPECPHCGCFMRPNVVLFGERLPESQVETLMSESQKGFDIVFSVGTTSVFPYISQPVYDAAEQFVPSVEINPGDTEVTRHVTYKLPMGAVEAFKLIKAAL